VCVMVCVFWQLLRGGEDDFSTLLYLFRCAQQAHDIRDWCRDWFVHQRVVRSGESGQEWLSLGRPCCILTSACGERVRQHSRCSSSSVAF
jgi:hypothetical protein